MPRKRKNPNSLMNNPDIALEPTKHQTSSPETKVRIIETARKISKGWTRLETIEWIKETYQLSEQSAANYWNAALSYLSVKASDSEYIEEMRKRTVSVVERLIQTEIDEHRYKEANSSLELLSKLLGYNTTKAEVKVDGDIHFRFGELPDSK